MQRKSASFWRNWVGKRNTNKFFRVITLENIKEYLKHRAVWHCNEPQRKNLQSGFISDCKSAIFSSIERRNYRRMKTNTTRQNWLYQWLTTDRHRRSNLLRIFVSTLLIRRICPTTNTTYTCSLFLESCLFLVFLSTGYLFIYSFTNISLLILFPPFFFFHSFLPSLLSHSNIRSSVLVVPLRQTMGVCFFFWFVAGWAYSSACIWGRQILQRWWRKAETKHQGCDGLI